MNETPLWELSKRSYSQQQSIHYQSWDEFIQKKPWTAKLASEVWGASADHDWELRFLEIIGWQWHRCGGPNCDCEDIVPDDKYSNYLTLVFRYWWRTQSSNQYPQLTFGMPVTPEDEPLVREFIKEHGIRLFEDDHRWFY